MLAGVPPLRFREFVLVYAANTTNRNVLTDAIAAGWDKSAPIRVLVKSGVTISSTAGTGPALQSGALTAPWFLQNLGNIQGYGGAAGGEETAGSPGGDALSTQSNLTIDNTSGNIYGGGGGGGGGGVGGNTGDATASAGGGGGGGQGQVGGAAGGGASQGSGMSGAGTAGTASTPGTGGSPGPNGSAGLSGGAGGNGGAWGQAGSAGANGSGTIHPGGGAGGAAGYAVRINGHTVTFTAGNNGTQVKGSVA